ncbi:diaminopimelate decarboxylase [Brevibacterium sp. GP-SGM9]|uniref:diaminopimelate decarboxylase n=1 Tax=Brevibacterium sp. GP-SGM9 TaxID=3376990 RepID=UPI0039A60C6F
MVSTDIETAPAQSLNHVSSRNRAIASLAQHDTRSGLPELNDEVPLIGLIDLDLLDRLFLELNTGFDVSGMTLHAVACKAAPIKSLLQRYASMGAGCEVASKGELELALTSGFSPARIVFDSPAKTRAELKRTLELGVSMNIDNVEELDRVDQILSDLDDPGSRKSTSVIGLRINPQTGSGEIEALSTASRTSKFGFGLADPGSRAAIIQAYLDRPWLSQIHVHSGSQGLTLRHAADGISQVVALAQEINDRSSRQRGTVKQITRIDIGGGLAVNFSGDAITPSFADYRQELEALVPELFNFDLVTEFGRALLAKAGTIVTRVEYVKTAGDRKIAVTHAGVQVATRTAYAPDDWPLRILPFDSEGRPKLQGDSAAHDIAGPACFAGDLLARDRMLPLLKSGDIVAVPETGAYYFSNHFSYNLLPRTPIYGYFGDDEQCYVQIRRGQTTDEVLAEASA